MFKCDYCKKITQPGEKCVLIPTWHRVRYPERSYGCKRRGSADMRFRGIGRQHLDDDSGNGGSCFDPGGSGHERTSEKKACEKCAAKHAEEAKFDPEKCVGEVRVTGSADRLPREHRLHYGSDLDAEQPQLDHADHADHAD